MGGSAEGIVQNLMAPTNPPGLVAQEIFVAPASMYHQAAFQGGELRKEQVEGWIGKHGFPPENLESTIAHPNYDDFWHETDATLGVSRINSPAVFLGGWFDTFCQGPIDLFLLRQHHGAGNARGNCMLIMGPWTHGGVGKVTMGELTFPDSAAFPPGIKATDWFGYWLKGEDTGIMEKPRVWYYTMGAVDEPGAPGNVWQTASDWPPPASAQPFYLRSGGLLSSARPTKAKASQSFDFDPKNPVPTVGGRNLEIKAGPMDQRSVEGRPDVLVFSTKPLNKPIEVTGKMSVDLFAASSATDTDFTAKLCDVYPDGRSIQIADGIIRAANRNTFLRDELIAPGGVYEYKIDLWSTSIVFNCGHRIRLEISSSNYPRFEINPNTGKRYHKGDKTEVAHQTIYMDADHPTALILPVVRNSAAER
jgi:hypothetical protein